MSLFVIGDLHLSYGVPEKTMEIFSGWENYHALIKENWLKNIGSDDTVVIAGDVSWGMSLAQAEKDFRFLEELPGRKIILKGNHDYWWTTKNKMDKYAVCGTRGWVNMPDEPADAKVLGREAQRLEVSLKSAVDAGLEPIVFMHYPPIFANSFNYDILDVLYRYKIKRCYYGHIHGARGHSLAVKGVYDDIDFTIISGDCLHFIPEKVI